jgi:hypothetical protein
MLRQPPARVWTEVPLPSRTANSLPYPYGPLCVPTVLPVAVATDCPVLGCQRKPIVIRQLQPGGHTISTVDHDPFVQSQLASRNEPDCLLRCKFGHATLKI